MRTLAAARVDSLLLGPALWLAGVGSGSERRNGSAAASWLSGGRSLQLSAALPSRPLYLGRLLRRGDSAVGHPPSLLWACRRESTVGSQAARAGPKGGGAARGRARQQLRLGNAAALRLARFARRALTHLRARTLAGGCSPSPLPFACADNIALGTACGKMFRCGVLSITDAGDSDILQKQPEA